MRTNSQNSSDQVDGLAAKKNRPETAPEHVLDVFLQPGEIYWSNDSATRIRTLLGSCVSICLWHPIRRIGGMCHYLLERRPHQTAGEEQLDARYGDEALSIFLKEIAAAGSRPNEYLAKVFGGGQMFTGPKAPAHIGEKNIKLAYRFLEENGIQVISHDHGGSRDRRLMFDLWSGNVWLKRKKGATGKN